MATRRKKKKSKAKPRKKDAAASEGRTEGERGEREPGSIIEVGQGAEKPERFREPLG